MGLKVFEKESDTGIPYAHVELDECIYYPANKHCKMKFNCYVSKEKKEEGKPPVGVFYIDFTLSDERCLEFNTIAFAALKAKEGFENSEEYV